MKKIRFVDCGANIGQSIEWALDVFKNFDLKIDSFEPLPKNLEVLDQKFSGLPNITIHASAVSTTDSIAIFYCQNWGARTGSSIVKGKSSTNDLDTVAVRTIDIANWLKTNLNEDETCVLKIDIEGAEYDVMPHLIDQGINKIVDYLLIEFHGTKTPNFNANVETLTKNSFTHFVDWSSSKNARNDPALVDLLKKDNML